MDECVIKRWNNAMINKINNITLKGIIDEDFVNYKVPSMTLMFPKCSLKCDKEYGMSLCHNSPLLKEPDVSISINKLVDRYLNNNITEAIVCQGMEPFDSFNELLELIYAIRIKRHCNDVIVIYTGYNKFEILGKLIQLVFYDNIIVKFGRFVPDQKPHYDEVLGVYLASDNQYAEKISWEKNIND